MSNSIYMLYGKYKLKRHDKIKAIKHMNYKFKIGCSIYSGASERLMPHAPKESLEVEISVNDELEKMQIENEKLRACVELMSDINNQPDLKLSEFSSSEALQDLFDYIKKKSKETLKELTTNKESE